MRSTTELTVLNLGHNIGMLELDEKKKKPGKHKNLAYKNNDTLKFVNLELL